MKPARPSALGRFLRLYLWLLLAALLLGFGVGLVIRERLERPQIHMGGAGGVNGAGAVARAVSAAAAPIPAL